ncbi:DUF4856 domain-containing protein [Crocinitomicaceae bacterium]|nr:DUF4856 domain-containing protein [Crocinitomicaceae bacterium]
MMKLTYLSLFLVAGALTFTSCKKKGCTDPTALNYDANAEKDDGSCEEDLGPIYSIPTTFTFTDANGNSTVSYQGQTDRLNQLSEMTALMGTGTSTSVNAQDLKDMYANVGDNGNGLFSFTSTKQLKNKTFAADQAMFERWMDDFAAASQDFAQTAASGQAGTVTNGTDTYLVDANGIELKQLIEKGLMGAVFLNQALNVYFGAGKMDVDNTTAEDPTNGDYYTAMEHHWDEAFGYFGVDTDFPTIIPSSFWGKYCDKQDATLNSNADMMTQFLTGRAAITGNVLTDRDAAIAAIRTEWEEISAFQAITYIDDCLGYFGSDQAKFLHSLSEAYAFAWNLRYAPTETRRMTIAEHDALMTLFPTNFWNITITDLNNIKNAIQAKY